MCVYVDPLVTCLPTTRWRWTRVSHLLADTPEELHTFAARLDLKREWFQLGSLPHYDLTPNKRVQAVLLGVVDLLSWEMVREVHQRLHARFPPSGRHII